MRSRRPEGSRELALVTGATGAIGPVLVRRLLAAGLRVRALVRRPVASHEIDREVEVVHGDLRDPEALARATDDARYVFHLGAKVHVRRPTREEWSEIFEINSMATERIVEASRSAGARRLVFFSTINVYGPTAMGIDVDEDASPSPRTAYALAKLEAEAHVLSATNAEGAAIGTVLRVAAVYGSRLRGNWARLVEAMARGRMVIVGRGENRRTLVHEEDLAEAALLAALDDRASGRVYNVTDGGFHRLRDIIAAIAHARGREPRLLRVPEAIARSAAFAVEVAFRSLRKTPPVDREIVAKLFEDVAVRGDRIQKELGFRPRLGLEEGWRLALAGESERGTGAMGAD
ncbi:MAG TPA: NAD-dependent epimerase/dehydratase family protein, partial [Planctomycetota bacterium]|nr:NAD-dependent epimerase/dehydratase family protein [Planctomycetota bacterium]